MLQPPLTEAAIRDTIAAVFNGVAYDRSVRQTLWDRFLGWLGGLLAPIGVAISESPTARGALVAGLIVLVAAIAARFAYIAYQQRDRSAIVATGRGTAPRRRQRDPWLEAQEQAARGNFTEAAHALYAALLLAIAQRERVGLHPSKTIGDYARELRQRSSALFTRYRDFARSYESVVYGIGTCDRDRYERLHALAATIVRPAR